MEVKDRGISLKVKYEKHGVYVILKVKQVYKLPGLTCEI